MDLDKLGLKMTRELGEFRWTKLKYVEKIYKANFPPYGLNPV